MHFIFEAEKFKHDSLNLPYTHNKMLQYFNDVLCNFFNPTNELEYCQNQDVDIV